MFTAIVYNIVYCYCLLYCCVLQLFTILLCTAIVYHIVYRKDEDGGEDEEVGGEGEAEGGGEEEGNHPQDGKKQASEIFTHTVFKNNMG